MGENQEQKDIISKILEAANHINRVARSGNADNVICSSEFSKMVDEQILILKSMEIDTKITSLLNS